MVASRHLAVSAKKWQCIINLSRSLFHCWWSFTAEMQAKAQLTCTQTAMFCRSICKGLRKITSAGKYLYRSDNVLMRMPRPCSSHGSFPTKEWRGQNLYTRLLAEYMLQCYQIGVRLLTLGATFCDTSINQRLGEGRNARASVLINAHWRT